MGKKKIVKSILISQFILISNLSVKLFFLWVFHIFLVVFGIIIQTKFLISFKTRIIFFYFHCVDLENISWLFFMRFEIFIIFLIYFHSLFFKIFIFFLKCLAKWLQARSIDKFLWNSTVSAILRISIRKLLCISIFFPLVTEIFWIYN